jgi:hypothetical protein
VQDKTNEGTFDFTVDVLVYEKAADDPKVTAEVSGRAHIYEDNKIANIDFLDDGTLEQALMEKNEVQE